MREQRMQPGAFVRHEHMGVGKLAALESGGQEVIVDFRAKPGHRMNAQLAARTLSVLPNNGLEAIFWENPETLRSWVQDAPLRLVAATLADMRGSGKPRDVREKLEGRVLGEVKWETWWKRVQPTVRDSSHFRVGKAGLITLLSQVENVPLEPASPPRKSPSSDTSRREPRNSSSERVIAWFQWLQWDQSQSPPGSVPPLALLPALDTWPGALVERATQRILAALEGLLLEKRSSPSRFPELWVEATLRITRRWIDYHRGEPPDKNIPLQLSILVARLFNSFAGEEKLNVLLSPLSELARQGGITAEGVALGLRRAFEDAPSGARAMLTSLAGEMRNEGSFTTLCHYVIQDALKGHGLQSGFTVVDTVLEANRRDKRGQIINGMVLDAVLGTVPTPSTLDYLARRWRTSRGPDHSLLLKPLLVAALLLDEDAGAQATDLAIDALRETLQEAPDTVLDVSMSRLLSVAREQAERIREEAIRLQESEKASWETRLSQTTGEADRLRNQAHDLHLELSRRREESALEARRDMLTAIGETLQVVIQRQGGQADLIRDVEAGLSLALQAGGAEELGKTGEDMPFDPRLHQADGEISVGTPVSIIAPGIVVRSRTLGDLTLIKARVKSSVGGGP